MMKILLLLMLITTTLKSEIINSSISINDTIANTIENKRLLFGNFFEFLNEFMNGEQGIWAQEIYDRGFDHYVNSNYAGRWEKLNNESDNTVSLKEGGYNKNGVYYQNIKSESEQVTVVLLRTKKNKIFKKVIKY